MKLHHNSPSKLLLAIWDIFYAASKGPSLGDVLTGVGFQLWLLTRKGDMKTQVLAYGLHFREDCENC